MRVLELSMTDYYRRFCETSLVTGTTSYAAAGTSLTAPSGNNVFQLVNADNGSIANGAMMKPFGQGADGETFTLFVYGWKRAQSSLGTTPVWTREKLYEIVCTLEADYSNTVTGASGYPIANSDKFCSTITMATGFGVDNVDYYFQGQPRGIYFDTKSSSFLQLEKSAGAATPVNALIQLV